MPGLRRVLVFVVDVRIVQAWSFTQSKRSPILIVVCRANIPIRFKRFTELIFFQHKILDLEQDVAEISLSSVPPIWMEGFRLVIDSSSALANFHTGLPQI